MVAFLFLVLPEAFSPHMLARKPVSTAGVQKLKMQSSAKSELLSAIAAYNDATAEDGVPSVDFGVKGGELDEESRAPRDLLGAGAFAAVSERVGVAADRVVAAVEEIAKVNPTPNPTAGLGDKDGATRCALHGRWYNSFTTAADATFSPDSKRGDALVSNVVDATEGRTVNEIEFLGQDNPAFRATRWAPKPPPLARLNVVLSAIPVSSTRVSLIFRRVRAVLNVKCFGALRQLTLVLPVPGPFITRILFFFRPAKKPPPAYFEVLYLDGDLRVHRTAQGNLFVQQREPAKRADGGRRAL